VLKIDGVTARTPLVATVDCCVIIDEGRQTTTTLLIRVFQHVKYKIVTLHVTIPLQPSLTGRLRLGSQDAMLHALLRPTRVLHSKFTLSITS
jgi:hypothetical protein